jgi:polysaccharide pyruvyl transferase CsaB
LIVGYYGYSNSGDEAILSSICHDINQLEHKAKITVLSHNPESTINEYDVASCNRFNFFKVVKAIKCTDIVLMGGGSLLQDGTSSRSLYYYLFILKLASIFKKKVMLYANGIGPINKVFNRKMTTRIVNKVELITLRESLSLEQLQLLGINKPAIHVTADPVFNMEISTADISVLKDRYQLGSPHDGNGAPF